MICLKLILKMLYKLKADKFSHMKPKDRYGRAGEVVRQISRSGNVLIVEGKTDRFAVLINQLIEMSDLEKFKVLFDRDKVKSYPTKLEYRTSELDKNLQSAREIITKHNLKLEAGTTGDMASYGAFEVKEI